MRKRKFSKKLTGFTLIELLVVMAVVASLATLGFTSFASAQKRVRDTKRKSDMKDIQSALEQYYSVCGNRYPLPTSQIYPPIICTTPGVSIAIMPTVPIDPKSGVTPYICPNAGDCDENMYKYCATLEGESPNQFCINSQQ